MQSKHLLIVDDQEDLLFFLEQGIRQVWPDYTVITANNGHDALECLQKVSVDLVLVDYHMPGMNGLELAQAVRRLAPNICIVMMSSVNPPEMKNGFRPYNAYLNKPFSISAIQPFVAACQSRG